MTNTLKFVVAAALLTIAVVTSGVSRANSDGGAFRENVGTHIYSPGPMAPATPFRLEMQMSSAAMTVIHKDMVLHPSVAGTHTISCTMEAEPHHRGMVRLTCSPGA
ncbi:MAG TPA: hypothetical protein PK677_17250 [Acidiphilium sp.]|uniref:hypothetical protein n=1 Tax=Acidiphilium sp. 37-64-53 TaxID=1970299 RepID=UPI00257987A7|nr:hypothetical protein [Acidiphilium sp. 37-64-53]HQT90252.1 hypothetical protein [Acidiphilium sp.]